jgi:hypothetical protein
VLVCTSRGKVFAVSLTRPVQGNKNHTLHVTGNTRAQSRVNGHLNSVLQLVAHHSKLLPPAKQMVVLTELSQTIYAHSFAKLQQHFEKRYVTFLEHLNNISLLPMTSKEAELLTETHNGFLFLQTEFEKKRERLLKCLPAILYIMLLHIYKTNGNHISETYRKPRYFNLGNMVSDLSFIFI